MQYNPHATFKQMSHSTLQKQLITEVDQTTKSMNLKLYYYLNLNITE